MPEQPDTPSPQQEETHGNRQQKKTWLSWLGLPAVLLLTYFANVEFQSYLGRKALANTGLEIHTLDDAFNKAKAENKQVLADMSAIWCTTCRKLDNEVLSHARVKQVINQHYVFARIEYESEEGQAFMAKYNVHGFPTLLILADNGDKIRQLPIIFDPDAFIALL